MRRIRSWALLVLLVAALTWASLPPARRLAAGETLDYAAAVGACAAAVAWLAVLWFVVCLSLVLLARLPGTIGRAAHRAAHSLTPGLVRRLVEATLGATLAVTATTHGGTIATAATDPNAATTHGGRGTTSAFANGADVGGPTAAPSLPPPDRPGEPPSRPDRPDRQDRQDHNNRKDRRDRKDERPRTVVVQPGDSLWRIAARSLPADPSAREVAAAWPRWYATNRAVIGADPDLILPGQHLRAPS